VRQVVFKSWQRHLIGTIFFVGVGCRIAKQLRDVLVIELDGSGATTEEVYHESISYSKADFERD